MPTSSPRIDTAIKAAQNLPDLVGKLNAVDPKLAQQLTGKALIASRSPWGTLLVAAVAFGAAKYGLGWDQSTDELVAGAGLLAGAYAMRWVTSAPIAGLLKKVTPVLLLAGLALGLGACSGTNFTNDPKMFADLAKDPSTACVWVGPVPPYFGGFAWARQAPEGHDTVQCGGATITPQAAPANMLVPAGVAAPSVIQLAPAAPAK